MKEKEEIKTGILYVDFPHQSFSTMHYPKKDLKNFLTNVQGSSTTARPIK